MLNQSEDDARALPRSRAAPPGRLVRIGIDLARFLPDGGPDEEQRQALRRELGVRPGNVLILSVGRLVVEKGIVELVEAFRAAAKRDAVSPAFLDAAERDGVALKR